MKYHYKARSQNKFLYLEIDPIQIDKILQKMDRNQYPIRGNWRITNSAWLEALRPAKSSTFPQQAIVVKLAKVEQLNRLDQVESAVRLLDSVRYDLNSPLNRIIITEKIRLDMVSCCRNRTEPSERLRTAIRRTLMDSQYIEFITPLVCAIQLASVFIIII